MKLELQNIKIQIALGLSAAAALIYEVVATNILLFYFFESSYSIATVLSVFLLGLSIGSLSIYYLLPKIKNKQLIFGILQIAIAIYAFLILTNLKKIIPPLETHGTFFTSFVILLIPTIFLGAIFPISNSLFKKGKNKEIVGLVYSSDLFGAIAGSLTAGYILIPNFGGRVAIIFGAALNLMSAFIIISKKYKIISIFILVLFIVSSFSFPGLFVDEAQLKDISDSEYDYYAHSPYGLVTIKNNCLYIEERQQCCRSYPNYTSERMMVDYALEPLISYSDLCVLNIGLGCGLTLEKCLEYNTMVDVVEINEKVVEANKIMTDVLDDDRVNLIIDDGLHYLRNNNKIYDSVLIDIENPTVVHSSYLYTVEAFEIINESLQNTGTFSLWCYSSSNPKYFDILYYSLKEKFAFVYYYPGVFLAAKQKIDRDEYVPTTPYEINTMYRNTLTDAYLERN